MTEVVIAESDQDLADRLTRGLAEAGYSTSVSESLPSVATLASNGSRVILVGPSQSPEAALKLAQEATAIAPGVVVILLAAAADADLYRRAMKAGLRDVLSAAEVDIVDVVESVRAVAGRAGAAASDLPPVSPGRVVMVQSTKGGVGKTMFASNLAVSLARLGTSTCLVDLDLPSGDIGLALGIDPTRTIADAAQAFDRLDRDLLGSLMLTHDSGLKVLLAPSRPEDAESVTIPRVSAIIDMLQTMFEVVVLDTGARMDDLVFTAVDKSDVIYAMATMDVASVKDTRVSVQRLRHLGYANGAVRLVLNRADAKVWLEPSEVERSVGTTVQARIPSDRLVPRSLNRGVPIVIDAPRSAVSKSITAVARQLMDEGGVQ